MLGDRLPVAPRRVRPRIFRPVLSRADAPWLAGLLAVGVAVYLVYLATNDYPAYGAGLYALAAERLIANGYHLVETIPHYSAEPIPFAYPPLGFYLFAVVLDATGAGPIAVSRYLPGPFVVAALVPAYVLARDLLGARPLGAAATLLIAVYPQVLEWHISAGGVVRAPAFLLSVAGLAVGVRLFSTDGSRRLLAAAVVLFGLTVLVHPTYTLFFGFGYLVLWAGLDRTVDGLGRGVIVAAGGVALAAPWWLTVASFHGFEVFTAAAGSHGGVGSGAAHLLAEGPSTQSLVPIAGGLVLLAFGHALLPAWLAVLELALVQSRFSYAVGWIVVVAAAEELVGARVRAGIAAVPPRRATAVVIAVAVVSASIGVGYLAYDFSAGDDDSTPAFVDDDDVAAMTWAERETAPGATFVVLGDAAEWFPAVTHRTILVGPWGAEWQSPATYERQLAAYVNASTCEAPDCLAAWLATVDADPTYLYVPREQYTVRGDRTTNATLLAERLRSTEGYTVAYENEGVVIFRRGPDAPASHFPQRRTRNGR